MLIDLDDGCVFDSASVYFSFGILSHAILCFWSRDDVPVPHFLLVSRFRNPFQSEWLDPENLRIRTSEFCLSFIAIKGIHL